MKKQINADTLMLDDPFATITSMTVKEHMDSHGKVTFRELIGLEVNTGPCPILSFTYAVRTE